MRRFVIKALAASCCLAVAGPALAADPAKKEIVIGTTVGDFGDMVKQSIKPILEKQGYAVKLVEFTDYVRPIWPCRKARWM
jgi:D-methionine transport system substrate-binding protein